MEGQASEEHDLLSKGHGRGKWKKEVLFLTMFLTNTLAFVTFGLIAPLFPEEAAAKGVSYTIQGWIFGVYALAAIITSPLVGKLMPYIGVRWTFMTGALSVSIWNILFGFLPWIEDRTLFIVSCFVCRIGMAFGTVAISISIFVIVTLTWPQDVTFRVGTIETSTSLGTLIGPSFSGKKVDKRLFCLTQA